MPQKKAKAARKSSKKGFAGRGSHTVAKARGQVGAKAVKVKPHQHKTGETYCIYEVTKSPQGAAIKVGESICILCAKDQDYCDDISQIEAGGFVYDVKGPTHPYCATCPSKNTYELA